MIKSNRNKIIISLLLLYAASFTMLYFAKPLSILTTCTRDLYFGNYSDCREFEAYFFGHSDGYHGDYSEYRDAFAWANVGIVLFYIGLPFLLFFAYKGFRAVMNSIPEMTK